MPLSLWKRTEFVRASQNTFVHLCGKKTSVPSKGQLTLRGNRAGGSRSGRCDTASRQSERARAPRCVRDSDACAPRGRMKVAARPAAE